MKLTYTKLKADLSRVGITLKKTEWNEYKVNYKGGKEETAYYTDSLADARGTGNHLYYAALPVDSSQYDAV